MEILTVLYVGTLLFGVYALVKDRWLAGRSPEPDSLLQRWTKLDRQLEASRRNERSR